jgi:tetratricopeptide (TPR) repeat protein
MKDYLQLDGMVYKLVPVKTKVDEESLDMGGIDADKMLQIVRKWGWGNGDKTTIYHDPETRKNSISYRTNLARLMEELINQKRYKEADEVMTMALEKMPLDYYGFYTMIDPFVEGYYEMGQTEKAHKLALQLIDKYRQELRYFAGIDHSIQNGIVTDIVSAIERYRSILIIAKDRKDMAFYNEQRKIFNGYLHSFKRFGRERE